MVPVIEVENSGEKQIWEERGEVISALEMVTLKSLLDMQVERATRGLGRAGSAGYRYWSGR